MRGEHTEQQTLLTGIVDFLAVGCTFYVSCELLSVWGSGDILLYTLLYASVIMFSVKLGFICLSSLLKAANGTVRFMLCNAAGLALGAGAMLTLGVFVPELARDSIVIFFASFMAFFVLGTLSPLLKSSGNDIHRRRNVA